MPLPIRDVIGILADNLRLRKSVLPISTRSATRWARDLNLPHGGDTVLYTGLMYQLIPYIEGLVKAEKGLGDTWLAKLTPLARQINRVINVSTFMVWPRGTLKSEFDAVPINVARLLRQRFEQNSRALQLTRSQCQVLAYLARREGIQQGELAALLEIEPITLTRLSTGWSRAGWSNGAAISATAAFACST